MYTAYKPQPETAGGGVSQIRRGQGGRQRQQEGSGEGAGGGRRQAGGDGGNAGRAVLGKHSAPQDGDTGRAIGDTSEGLGSCKLYNTHAHAVHGC